MANIAIFVSLLLALSVSVDAQEFNNDDNICRGFDAFCQLRDGIIAGFYGNRYALLRQSIAIGPDDDLITGCPLGNFNFKVISIDNMQTDIDPDLAMARDGVSSCVRVYFGGTPYIYLMARNGMIYDASDTPVGDTPFSSTLTSTAQLITTALPNIAFPIDLAIDTGVPTVNGWYIYGLRTRPTGSLARRWYWTPPTTGTGFTFVDQGSVDAEELLDLSDIDPEIDLTDVGDCAAIRLNNGLVWYRCHGEDENGMRVAFGLTREGANRTVYTFTSDGEDSVPFDQDPLIGALFRGFTLCSMDADAGDVVGPLIMGTFFNENPYCTICDTFANPYGTSAELPALPRIDTSCPTTPIPAAPQTGAQYTIDAIASHPDRTTMLQYSFYGSQVYVHSADTAMDGMVGGELRPRCRSILFPDMDLLDSTVRIEAAFSPMGSNSIYLVFRDPGSAAGTPVFLYQQYSPDPMGPARGFAPVGGNEMLNGVVGTGTTTVTQLCTPTPTPATAMLMPTRVFSAFTRARTGPNAQEEVVFFVESMGFDGPTAVIVPFTAPGTFGTPAVAIPGDELGAATGDFDVPLLPGAAVYRRGATPVLVIQEEMVSNAHNILDGDTDDLFPNLAAVPTVAAACAFVSTPVDRYMMDPAFMNLIGDCT